MKKTTMDERATTAITPPPILPTMVPALISEEGGGVASGVTVGVAELAGIAVTV
jgi:hypothetical protein